MRPPCWPLEFLVFAVRLRLGNWPSGWGIKGSSGEEEAGNEAGEDSHNVARNLYVNLKLNQKSEQPGRFCFIKTQIAGPHSQSF